MENIKGNVHWLISRAYHVKDPYYTPEEYSMAGHPFRLPPPTGQKYPENLEPFSFIGKLVLNRSRVSDFEDAVTKRIMQSSFPHEPFIPYLRKIKISQPENKNFPRTIFFEAQVEYSVLMAGGMIFNGDILKRMDDFFETLKWLYEIDLYEEVLPFGRIRNGYYKLKKELREYHKGVDPILEERDRENFFGDR
jgi:hypothetical protein